MQPLQFTYLRDAVDAWFCFFLHLQPFRPLESKVPPLLPWNECAGEKYRTGDVCGETSESNFFGDLT